MHTLILIFHVLGAGILFSIGIFSLLITSKGTVSKERIITLSIIEKLAPLTALWQLLTGLLLYSYDSTVLNKDPLFWIKIIFFIISGFFAGNIIKRKKIKLLKQKGNTVKVGNFPFFIGIEILIILTIISIGVILVETK